jgi:hypothetical protein
MTKEKPIIFSAPAVKAVLEGRKTVTRRVIKPQPTFEPAHDGFPDFWHWKDCQWADGGLGMPESAIEDYAPYKPGDILWVRETWYMTGTGEFLYRADNDVPYAGFVGYPKWRPSIFMLRKAARLFLEVKSVRAERLQDISKEDAEKEAAESYPIFNDFDGYALGRQPLCNRFRFCGTA